MGRKTGKADTVIGAMLRDRRSAAGITQVGMGKRLGVSFQQVQKYEHGTSRISLATFVKAARALEIAPSSLLQEVEAKL